MGDSTFSASALDAALARLRRAGRTRHLSDGREAVDVTIQFRGALPSLARAERKKWLAEHFAKWSESLGEELIMQPSSMSVSAQTIDAILPVDTVAHVVERAAETDHRVQIVERVKATEAKS